jgi:hypothetical protein
MSVSEWVLFLRKNVETVRSRKNVRPSMILTLKNGPIKVLGIDWHEPPEEAE